jgi:hypothetical protein
MRAIAEAAVLYLLEILFYAVVPALTIWGWVRLAPPANLEFRFDRVLDRVRTGNCIRSAGGLLDHLGA